MKVFACPLFAVVLALVLAGCATGPTLHTDPAVAPAFESLKTTDLAIQKKRFGDYADTAGKFFVGRDHDNERLSAVSYQWIIPGVVLEQHVLAPYLTKLRLQYNPATWKLDVFNMLGNEFNQPKHIRELSIQPDGAIEWPTALMGLEPASSVRLNEMEELVRDVNGDYPDIVVRRVTQEQFEVALGEERLRLAREKNEATRRSTAFLNGAAQAISSATEAARLTHEQQQLQQAQRQSALMAAQYQESQHQSQALEHDRTSRLDRESAKQRSTESDHVDTKAVKPVSSNAVSGSTQLAGNGALKVGSIGSASTDTDANMCISGVTLGPDPNCKHGNSAAVVNNCPQKIDARICIMTTKGKWNCGVVSGIHPGQTRSHASCYSTGRTFVSARSSSSDRRFGNPPD